MYPEKKLAIFHNTVQSTKLLRTMSFPRKQRKYFED